MLGHDTTHVHLGLAGQRQDRIDSLVGRGHRAYLEQDLRHVQRGLLPIMPSYVLTRMSMQETVYRRTLWEEVAWTRRRSTGSRMGISRKSSADQPFTAASETSGGEDEEAGRRGDEDDEMAVEESSGGLGTQFAGGPGDASRPRSGRCLERQTAAEAGDGDEEAYLPSPSLCGEIT